MYVVVISCITCHLCTGQSSGLYPRLKISMLCTRMYNLVMWLTMGLIVFSGNCDGATSGTGKDKVLMGILQSEGFSMKPS